MIIELLLDVIFNIFNLLTLPINIPNLPDSVMDFLVIGMQYVIDGCGILSNFIYLPFAFTLLGIIVAVDIGIGVYKLVMWILRKIPVASIS